MRIIISIFPWNTSVCHNFVILSSVVEFIRNFTIGDLDRHLRMPVRKLADCKHEGDANICVEEVTTSTFSDIVLDESKVKIFLLMFYE